MTTVILFLDDGVHKKLSLLFTSDVFCWGKKKYGSTISTNLWQSLENIFRSQAFLLDDEEFTSGWIESYVIPIPSLPMAYFQVD